MQGCTVPAGMWLAAAPRKPYELHPCPSCSPTRQPLGIAVALPPQPALQTSMKGHGWVREPTLPRVRPMRSGVVRVKADAAVRRGCLARPEVAFNHAEACRTMKTQKPRMDPMIQCRPCVMCGAPMQRRQPRCSRPSTATATAWTRRRAYSRRTTGSRMACTARSTASCTTARTRNIRCAGHTVRHCPGTRRTG